MILNLGPLGKGRDKLPPMFTIDGEAYDGKTDETTSKFVYKKTTDSSTGKVNWEIAFLSGCTLSFSRVVDKIDVFLVGGGSAGQNGGWDEISSGPRAVGGKGGNGGYVFTHKGVTVSKNNNYSIVIGGGGTRGIGQGASGSAGSESTAFGLTSGSGSRKSGKNGAKAWASSSSDAGTPTENGYYSFGETDTSAKLYEPSRRYGAAGGGGAAKFTNTNYVAHTGSAASGGTTGGGDGGNLTDGSSASPANTGAGGGGGGVNVTNGGAWNDYLGGNGASGIVIIRNAR